MSNKSGFPSDTFWFAKKTDQSRSDVQEINKACEKKKAALDLLKRNSTTLNDSSEIIPRKKRASIDAPIYIDDQVDDEIPATQEEPVDLQYEQPSTSNKIQVFENKSLKKVQRQTRMVSMLSSPSIMHTKPKIVEPSFNEAIKEKIALESKNAEKLFDEFKKCQDTDIQNTSGTSSTSVMKEVRPEPTKNVLQGSSPVKKFDDAQIQPSVMKNFMDNCADFRSVLDELKKTTDMITEFRQALASSKKSP